MRPEVLSIKITQLGKMRRMLPEVSPTTAKELVRVCRTMPEISSIRAKQLGKVYRMMPEVTPRKAEQLGKMQDNPVCTENAFEHSFILIEDLESDIQKGEDEANSCQDKSPDSDINRASPIRHDVCQNAV